MNPPNFKLGHYRKAHERILPVLVLVLERVDYENEEEEEDDCNETA